MRYNCKIPIFISFFIELAAAVPVPPLYLDHDIKGSTVIALYNGHAIFK